MDKKNYVLQDWSIVGEPDNPYQAPELWTKRLRGKVFGHKNFKDGEFITTSPIVAVLETDKYETANSIVHVGKKDPAYELFCNDYNSKV